MSTPERIRTVIVDDHDEIGRLVARRIAEVIRERRRHRRRPVLGLATGSTPIGVYRELIRMHREEGLSFADVDHVQSRRVLPDGSGEHPLLPPVHVGESLLPARHPSPRTSTSPAATCAREEVEAECRRYEEAIAAAGGIDLQLLGIGRTGHIGFNEPGSGLDSRTRLVTLDLVTRKDTAADFFGEENVPREAITMGVATILDAREILILATGRAQGGHRAPRGRGRGRPRGGRHLPPAAPRDHRLSRPGRGGGAHPRGHALAARAGGVDAGPRWCARSSGSRTRPARRSSS